MNDKPGCTCLRDFNRSAIDGCHNVEGMQEYLSGPHTCPNDLSAPLSPLPPCDCIDLASLETIAAHPNIQAFRDSLTGAHTCMPPDPSAPFFPSLLEPPERDPHPRPPDPQTDGRTLITSEHPGLTPHQTLEIAAVKAALADTAAPIREPHLLSVCFRHSGWQGDRIRIYEAFHRTHQPHARQANFEHCGAHAHILQNLEDPTVYRIAGSGCHDRFCLPCANERSRAIALNVIDVLKQRTLRFLTLTVKSNAEPLTELLDKLHTSFQKLRRTKLWKKCVTGGVAFLEINWSPDKQRWHPHFHILIEGSYLPYPQLRNLWHAITGDSFVIEIRIVHDSTHAARYVTKYASKPFNKTFIAIPKRLDEAILALKGRKLCVTFGSWRGITLLDKPSDGAWQDVGTLQRFIERAAAGHQHSRQVLQSMTDRNLDSLYARAPPLPPTGPNQSIPDPQATWFGVWKENNAWSYPSSLRDLSPPSPPKPPFQQP